MNSLHDPQVPAAPVSPPVAVPPPPPVASPVESATHVWACPCCRAALRTVAEAQRGSCPACGSVIEAPAPPPPPPSRHARPPHTRSRTGFATWSRRRFGRFIGLFALVAIVAATAIWLHRARPWTPLLEPAVAATAPATPDELKAKLHRFLQARDWAGKRAFVLDAARLDRAGTAYYDGRDPDRIAAASFEPWSLPNLEKLDGVSVLRAERPGRRPVWAVFRESKGGWHLDWELYCQTYDESLPTYLAHPSFPIRTFRARLGRVFAEAGSGPAGGEPAEGEPSGFTIELSDPFDSGQRLTIELPHATPIMRSVAGGLHGTTSRDATVEVSWARPDVEGEWVPMLQRLVCWGWDGLNGQPETSTPAPPAHERFQLPTTAPRNSPAPPAEPALAAANPVAAH